MTFRISKNIIDLLHSESEKKKISLNALVAQILNRYVEWEQYENKTGMVSLPRPVITELFQKMNEEEIVALAKTKGKEAMLDVALFMNNIGDLDSFLKWFEIRMQNSSIQINRTIQNNINYYVFKHDLGRKWSLYYKTILESIFRESFGTPTEIAISDSILKFSVNT